MRLRVPLALLLALAAIPLPASDTVGTLAYREGQVQIVRDEDALEAKLVTEGLAIRNYDLLITGADGEAELRITSPSAPATTIRIAPNTRFTIEIGTAAARQQTTVGLLIGCVTVKCAKLTGSQGMSVKTEAVVMGVRGTGFTVAAPASGDVLVTCDEGEVECTDERGRTERAGPGETIERLLEERFRRVPVAAASLEQYARAWGAERVAALKADALKATTALARRYATLLRQFDGEYAQLMKARDVIEKWKAEDRDGKPGGAVELPNDKKRVIGGLLRLRRTLFALERVHVRLAELEGYHDEGYGRGTIRYLLVSETTTEFFRRFAADRAGLEKRMAVVRQVTRLYALRNGGRAPTGAFDVEEDEDSFLDG